METGQIETHSNCQTQVDSLSNGFQAPRVKTCTFLFTKHLSHFYSGVIRNLGCVSPGSGPGSLSVFTEMSPAVNYAIRLQFFLYLTDQY